MKVVPENDLPQGGADFAVAFEAELDRAAIFVQLLGNFATRRPPDLPQTYALHQFEAFVDLFRRGYLKLIYLMITSLKQIPVLAKKKNSRFLKASEGLSGRPDSGHSGLSTPLQSPGPSAPGFPALAPARCLPVLSRQR